VTALLDILRRRIAQDGPMRLSDYMALCLGHPEHGYYRTRDPLGAAGDFITAPEISQMFGEMIGLWAVAVWRGIGAPSRFQLVELGPGRGTLMADALRAATVDAEFGRAAAVWLVETSPALRAEQASRVPGARWAETLGEVPAGPMILLANEFFDALPIRQFVKAADGWRERMVGLSGGALAFGLAPPGPLPSAPLAARFADAPEGAVVETSPLSEAIAAEIGARLAADPGAALLVDYGYAEASMPEAGGDTFQALSGHAFANPLAAPGEADLTAHVNFSALARAATGAGATAHPLTGQGAFLTALGVGARAASLAARHPGRAAELQAQLTRLTAPDQMGRLFKVLALTSPGTPAPPGLDGRR